MNKAYQTAVQNAITMPEATANFPPQRVVEQKIGRTTFIVSSRCNNGKEKDIVSTIARLVQHDTGGKGQPE